MAEDTKTDVVVATGEWGRPTTQREAARSQMLWMVGQASRAAKSGRVDDARWWRDRAVSALWNMNQRGRVSRGLFGRDVPSGHRRAGC